MSTLHAVVYYTLSPTLSQKTIPYPNSEFCRNLRYVTYKSEDRSL